VDSPGKDKNVGHKGKRGKKKKKGPKIKKLEPEKEGGGGKKTSFPA